jgi:hypothetical protein
VGKERLQRAHLQWASVATSGQCNGYHLLTPLQKSKTLRRFSRSDTGNPCLKGFENSVAHKNTGTQNLNSDQFTLGVQLGCDVGRQFNTSSLVLIANREMKDIFFLEVNHSGFIHCTLPANFWNGQMAANLLDELVGDFCMPWHSLHRSRFRVTPQRVRSTLAFQIASVPAKVSQQR